MVNQLLTVRPLVAVACLLSYCAPAIAVTCQPVTFAGEVTHVRDGDTIEVEGLAIRLNGLAAPERSEPAGDRAFRVMRTLVLGRTLRCDLDGERTRDRCVGICYLEGTDIAAALVGMGLARDCPRFSGGRYRKAELSAVEQGSLIRSVYKLPAYCEEP